MSNQLSVKPEDICDDDLFGFFEEQLDDRGEDISPIKYDSLSEYVLAVAEKTCTTCQLDERRVKILSDRLGLLNVQRERTLKEVGAELGVTHESVRQIAERLESGMFSTRGKAMFASFTACAASIFAQGNGVIKVGELVAGINNAYPNWTGTTEFSVLKLLEFCGVAIESNKSGLLAWMEEDGRIEQHYEAFLRLLKDENIPLETFAPEALFNNVDSLGLEGITKDEYRFLVQRAFDRKDVPDSRRLFLKLRCGMQVGEARQRRYVEAQALRKAGMRGLTYAELVDACGEIDSSVDIGDENLVKSDTNPVCNYDMDGTGAGLLIYDFGDATHERRYSLDVFFKDEELVRVIMEAGNRLQRHMEENSLGAANITRLVDEINDCLPEPYASEGLPSACIYHLMRKYCAGRLKYYNHPNVAHPDLVEANGGKVPEMAISWVVYKYFLCAGHKNATSAQLIDFCDVMLGMNRVIAQATVLPNVMGERVSVGGESRYVLKPPVDGIAPPQVLLDGGKFDVELTFSRPRLPLDMRMDASGRARNFSTYIRLFLLELAKSGYAFTEDEERELADAGWCGRNLGSNKAVFVRAEPGSTRPNMGYWRVTYRVGETDYWVSSSWRDEYKGLFDNWAQALAERAGLVFEPYELLRPEVDEMPCQEVEGDDRMSPDVSDLPLFTQVSGRQPAVQPVEENDELPGAKADDELEMSDGDEDETDDDGGAEDGAEEESESSESEQDEVNQEGQNRYLRMALEAFEARNWNAGFDYARQTDMKDARIQYWMGYCHELGLADMTEDPKNAARWYLLAAEQGDSDAQYRLAVMYAYKHGVTWDLDKAIYWYRKAASQGNEDAVRMLHEIGVPIEAEDNVNVIPSAEYVDETDDSGEAPVEEGEDWLINQALDAFENEHWAMGMVYAERTDKSDSEIQFYVGYCNENGFGTEKSLGEAFRWYDMAVSQGNVKAMLRLAGMYERGDWVDYNIDEAARLYVCATIKGDDVAKQRIGELSAKDNSLEAVVCQVQKAFENAEWAKVVCIAFLTDMTDANLQYYIGYCCENGLGMEKDVDAAREWYRKSAENFISRHNVERN